MMGARRFKQVDVFTNKKYKGNPVAVFFDADDLKSEEMQAIQNGQIYLKLHSY